MFSYRHAFHAGNHADVLKHLVLIHSVSYLQEKDGSTDADADVVILHGAEDRVQGNAGMDRHCFISSYLVRV